MKAVIQRVDFVKVIIDEQLHSSIGKGLLVLLGVMKDDVTEIATKLARKIIDLRIFEDEQDKMNLSVKDIDGEVMVISQFTLCTDNEKSGNRPSFSLAEEPERAKTLYEYFIRECCNYYNSKRIKSGIFGAMMRIELVNNGPVTIILEK
ncbi:MAG: D-aminoacyl-tRNA deacylase [Ignavibacteria bacterium]